jgi:alpha-1,4-digalacturonate transport system permease protein
MVEQRIAPSPAARRRRRPANVGLWAVAALGAAIMIFPTYWMVVTALRPRSELFSPDAGVLPSQVDLSNFTVAWDMLPWGRWFLNSALIVVISIVLALAVNVPMGYALAKFRFRGRNVLFLLIVSALAMPIQAILVPEFLIVTKLGWVNSIWGAIIPRVAEVFGVFVVRQFMLTIPDELLEAARLDGASEFQIFRRIVLPMSKPAIGVIVIFTALWRWNDFEWPIVVLQDREAYTVQLGLVLLKSFDAVDWNAIMAMALLSILPVIIIFVAFQRYFIQAIANTGLK